MKTAFQMASLLELPCCGQKIVVASVAVAFVVVGVVFVVAVVEVVSVVVAFFVVVSFDVVFVFVVEMVAPC